MYPESIRMSQKKQATLALILMGLLVGVFYWRIWTPREIDRAWFEGDIFDKDYPARAAWVRILHEGAFPFWNPYAFGGWPMLANCEAGVLYPPNWLLIPRRCVQESTVAGYRIPIGTWVYVFPYVIHRDQRWFPDPESFEPDRFDPKNSKRLDRLAYIPLGMGPHVCLGRALATIILTSILARILQEFRLELPIGQTEIASQVGIVIKPANGLPLTVRRREGS